MKRGSKQPENALLVSNEAGIGSRAGAPSVIRRAGPYFNCDTLLLTLDDLVRLEADVKNDSLPCNDGFFFGISDGTEKEDDIMFIENARQAIQQGYRVFSRAARNMILLGDPQQLEQPQLGDHPEGAGVASLAHALSDRDTIESTKGIFLGSTWRLSPDITKFTSEQYYDGRLTSEPGPENQKIVGSGKWFGSGLRFLELRMKAAKTTAQKKLKQSTGWLTSSLPELTNGQTNQTSL